MSSGHYLYIMATPSEAYKIGITHSPGQRLSAVNSSSPEPVSLLFALKVSSEKRAREFEKKLHKQLAEYCIKGEWFKADRDLLLVTFFNLMIDSGISFLYEKRTNLNDSEPQSMYSGPARAGRKTEARISLLKQYLKTGPLSFIELEKCLGLTPQQFTKLLEHLDKRRFQITRIPGGRRGEKMLSFKSEIPEDLSFSCELLKLPEGI